MTDTLPTLLVGSYTATGGGTATGISLVAGGPVSAAGTAEVRTVAVIDDPSFLAVDGDRVYAVSETVDGGVSAFRRNGTALEHLWNAAAGGDAPCHVRVDESGALVVTNYVSGTVTAISLAAADAVVAASGAVVSGDAVVTAVLPDVLGPVEDRQEGPHAHQTIGTPDGTLLVADLGGDALHEFRVTGTPTLELLRVHHLTPGIGPRHLAWVDRDLVVAGELDGHVHRLRRDDTGSFVAVASAATFDRAVDGAVDASLLSHIEVDDAGRVVVAVRGRDRIVVLDASDGGLSLAGSASSGGVWPRHFARVPGFLLVANQMSDAVAVLPVGTDGVPGDAVAQIPVGTPTCIVPF